MDRLWSFFDSLIPLVPPALGALVGLRYAQNQTMRDRAVAYVGSVVLGIYLGPALGEHLSLGPKTIVGVSFLIAMLGTELFAVAVAAMRQWAADPVGTFAKWRDALLGRKP